MSFWARWPGKSSGTPPFPLRSSRAPGGKHTDCHLILRPPWTRFPGRIGQRAHPDANPYRGATSSAAPGRGLGESLLLCGGVLPDHYRIFDRHDLVGAHADPAGVLADGGLVGGLVDAKRPQAAVGLAHHVGPNPAHLVGHLLVAHPRGYAGGDAQFGGIFPVALAANDEGFHDRTPWLGLNGRRRWHPPSSTSFSCGLRTIAGCAGAGLESFPRPDQVLIISSSPFPAPPLHDSAHPSLRRFRARQGRPRPAAGRSGDPLATPRVRPAAVSRGEPRPGGEIGRRLN